MFGQLKILMLEDTEAHQALMTHMLNKIGVNQIAFARTPGDFFELLAQRGGDFNALIIDVQLGEGQMDGLQALSEARKRNIKYPAVIITMDTTDLDFSHCYQLGVTEIVDKETIYADGVMEGIARGLNDRVIFNSLSPGVGMLVPVVHDEIAFLPASDVLYFQLEDGVYTIHTYQNDYRTIHNLRMYSRLLEEHGFLSVSKNHLVNMHRVERLDPVEQKISFYYDPLNRTIPVAEAKLSAIRKELKSRQNRK
ncbi:response regulator transcription factor [Brevibacillus borstelensis]|uniref:response regulator transcription factor n=1 Tax=Brevibacillus borstelensis TaxID=45462 RepID=UPI0004F25C2B|nr:response regulator transcription factor [Brevibacillus borstelensis]KKX53277.1 hypothetical protein X546_20595 [Brevibacillus borstelensis cifa_chp40]